ncbi:hypothetical protein FOCC_FOCC004424 [Frankliniella occidentalis]|nr:hypothetical protein FOCC_FOCC004424 [Frankliniella occidentalis]
MSSHEGFAETCPLSPQTCPLSPQTCPQTSDLSEALTLFRVSYLWYVPLSLLVGVGVAALAALLGWRSDLRRVEPCLVAPLARRFLPAAEKGVDALQERPAGGGTAAEQALLLADLRVSLQNLDKNYKDPEKKLTIEECAR